MRFKKKISKLLWFFLSLFIRKRPHCGKIIIKLKTGNRKLTILPKKKRKKKECGTANEMSILHVPETVATDHSFIHLFIHSPRSVIYLFICSNILLEVCCLPLSVVRCDCCCCCCLDVNKNLSHTLKQADSIIVQYETENENPYKFVCRIVCPPSLAHNFLFNNSLNNCLYLFLLCLCVCVCVCVWLVVCRHLWLLQMLTCLTLLLRWQEVCFENGNY